MSYCLPNPGISFSCDVDIFYNHSILFKYKKIGIGTTLQYKRWALFEFYQISHKYPLSGPESNAGIHIALKCTYLSRLIKSFIRKIKENCTVKVYHLPRYGRPQKIATC
jgi:hypothetical protein